MGEDILARLKADKAHQRWQHGPDGYRCHCWLCDGIAEIERLSAALREVYEMSEGFVHETAPEGYQQRLIEKMRDAAARGLAEGER